MFSLKFFLVMALLPHVLDAASLRGRDVVCSFSSSPNNGDTCESFAAGWGLSVADFKALNPSLNCASFVSGIEYCVIGTITTPASTTSTKTTTKSPTATITTISSKKSTTSSSKTSSTSKTSTTPASPTNTMPGLAANCNKKHLVASGDTCATIETKYGISAAQFTSWNTYIDKACSNLWLGYYVCVGVPGTKTTTSTKPTPTPTCPQPQMPSIVSNCKKCRLVQSGDTCDTIDKAQGITLSNFLKWNPFVSAKCDNLWLGYYVCVGV